MSRSLNNDINYVLGPEGQVVVVVRPDQREIAGMDEIRSNILAVCCAVFWGVLGFPFLLLGFIFFCIEATAYTGAVMLIGSIFFGFGLFSCFLFGICMYVRHKDHNKQIQRHMNQNMGAPEEEQLMIPTSIGNASLELTPYQRFMMYRGTEGASPSGSRNLELPLQTSTSEDARTEHHPPSAIGVPAASTPQVDFTVGQISFGGLQRDSEDALHSEQTVTPLVDSFRTSTGPHLPNMEVQVIEPNILPEGQSLPSPERVSIPLPFNRQDSYYDNYQH